MRGTANRGPTEQVGALRRARALLEVSAHADVAELTRAYWRQARRTHPDLSSAPDATQQFQTLHDAYRLALDTALDTAPSAASGAASDAAFDGAGDTPSQAGQGQPGPGRPSASSGTTATRAQFVRGRTRGDLTDPPQPAASLFDAAGSGPGDGVWLVAGPVQVRPPRQPDGTRTPREARP